MHASRGKGADALVVWRHGSPAADGTLHRVMLLGRAGAPSKVEQAQVQAVPLCVRPEQLEVRLRLLHAVTVCQTPALGQPAQAVHRELYEDAGIRCSYGSWHGSAGCVG